MFGTGNDACPSNDDGANRGVTVGGDDDDDNDVDYVFSEDDNADTLILSSDEE